MAGVSDADVPQEPRDSWSSRLVKHFLGHPLPAVLVALVCVIAATIPFGGFARAEVTKPGLKQLEVGVEHTFGPLKLTIIEASWDTDPQHGQTDRQIYPSVGGAYLMVHAKIRAVGKSEVPFSVLNNVMRVQNLGSMFATAYTHDSISDDGEVTPGKTVPDEEAEYTVANMADAISLPSIGPGMTYDVVFIFGHRGTDFPNELTLHTYDFTWRASSIDGSFDWRDPEVNGQVTMPLKPSKAQQQRLDRASQRAARKAAREQHKHKRAHR
jgi:hypothetical protein